MVLDFYMENKHYDRITDPIQAYTADEWIEWASCPNRKRLALESCKWYCDKYLHCGGDYSVEKKE